MIGFLLFVIIIILSLDENQNIYGFCSIDVNDNVDGDSK